MSKPSWSASYYDSRQISGRSLSFVGFLHLTPVPLVLAVIAAKGRISQFAYIYPTVQQSFDAAQRPLSVTSQTQPPLMQHHASVLTKLLKCINASCAFSSILSCCDVEVTVTPDSPPLSVPRGIFIQPTYNHKCNGICCEHR